MENSKKQKVLVAMSGGVDSSVAALLLKEKGLEVIGVFLKCYSNTKNSYNICSWREERKSALQVASVLKIPLITKDYEKEYKKLVIEEMIKNYKKGITPNPDIDCNKKIKFPYLLNIAKILKADFISTGHYAQIKKNKKYELFRAKDELKDQSYFLYRLNEKQLKKILFPIGNLTKKQVRDIAKKRSFKNFNKKGTVGICFIGKINLKKFLKKKIKPKKGKIINPEGNQIGEHDGIYYYTIGQRIGPRYGIEIKKRNEKQVKRWYVARKNVKKNIIVAAPENHPLLFRKEILIRNFHLISEDKVKFKKEIQKRPLRTYSRIRHVGELLKSTLYFEAKKNLYKIILNKAITGVSNGQAIVIYKGKKVLGGGVIWF